MQRPNIPTADRVDVELPTKVDPGFERLPPVHRTIEASVSSIAKSARADARIRAELDRVIERDDLDLVVIADQSRRVFARAPITRSTRYELDAPSGELQVAIVRRGDSAHRSYLLRRTVRVTAGETYHLEIPSALHQLTVSVPSAAQPVVLELTRPDDPGFSLTRPTRIERIDTTQEVSFESIGAGDYLLIAHRPTDGESESIPITVFEPTWIELSSSLR